MFALPTPHIKSVVNVESSGTGRTVPTLPVIQVVVVNPVGIDFSLLTSVHGDGTIIIPVIMFQDLIVLSAWGNL